MKEKSLIWGTFIGIFILIILIVEGWFLYHAMGPGTLFIGNVTLVMFFICGAGIFLLIAHNIKEIIKI